MNNEMPDEIWAMRRENVGFVDQVWREEESTILVQTSYTRTDTLEQRIRVAAKNLASDSAHIPMIEAVIMSALKGES